MRREKREEKKKHTIRNIILILLAVFVIWLFWPTNNGNDDYDYDAHHSSESSSSSPVSSSGSAHEPVTLSAELPSGAVRPEQSEIKGDGEDTVTVLIYMNGSNLESDDGSATSDIEEMIAAGSSDKVNVLIQTMGTREWSSTYGIASNRSQIYKVDGSGLTLLRDDLGQLDCTAEKTLKDFVSWGTAKYPADRYILLLWDHGGGPVYGFGYDEYQDEDASLTLDEIRSALKSCDVYFDVIGFDACLMSSLEVCAALYDACDYTILSEDFEPGIGWYYTDWLKALYKNSSISIRELGKIIVDGTVKANEDANEGEDCILAVMDQGMMKVLYTSWVQFAYANEDELLGNNYSRQVRTRGRTLPRGGHQRDGLLGLFSDWLSDEDEDYSLEDYYISDIMALASTIDSEESAALSSALSQAIVYVNSTSGISGETGISVTLPYGDEDFYEALKVIFSNCGIDSEYISWLGKFTSASGSSSYYDFEEFDDEWDNWDSYEDDYDWSLWDLLFDEEFWEDEDDDWDWGY